jgi:hypothetical protein
MATRMQQRRGTALQWTTADPILNAGEMGWESDTNKFKIGDGTNHWSDLDYFLDAVALGGSIDDYIPLTQKDAASGVPSLDASKNLIVAGASIIVEGATDNGNETTLTVTDPTADRTITFPDATGTVQLRVTDVSDTEIGYLNGVTSAIQTQLDDKSTASKTETLTNKTLTSPKINEDVAITATATELNYVDGVTSSIQTQLNALAPKADPTFTGTVSAANLTLSGDLTVNGTTTNINSTSLVVEDKNIVLGDATTPTDTTADGGGITLKGATDKTFNWVDSTDAWTSSEHINLASGKTLKYNGTDLVAAQSGNSGKYLTTDGTSTSWGTVSGYSAPTLGSTSIASGATVTTVAGLTLTAPTLTGTVTASGDINLSAAGGPGSVIDEFTLLLMGAL